MAKSTFLQMCQDTRRECGVAGTGPADVGGQSGILEKIVKWVQYSTLEIEGRWLNWEFMHVDDWSATTTIDSNLVLAPDDIGVWDEDSFVVNQTLSTWYNLVPVSYQQWRDTLRNGPQTSNKPTYVTIKFDHNLTLTPTPDAAYSLSADYWRKPKKLIDNSDTSYIPEEFERIILSRAVLLYAIDHGAVELIASYQVEYDDLLDKLEAKYLPDQKARRMTGADMVVIPQ